MERPRAGEGNECFGLNVNSLAQTDCSAFENLIRIHTSFKLIAVELVCTATL